MNWLREALGNWLDPYRKERHELIDYLSRLDRCCAQILLAGGDYDDKYTCEIRIAAKDLLPWAQNHSHRVHGFGMSQVARLALPRWLSAAEPSSEQVTYLDEHMHDIIEHYIGDLVEDGTALVHCTDCGHEAVSPSTEQLDKKQFMDEHWWTDVWKCPAGHLLYKEDHHLRFFR